MGGKENDKNPPRLGELEPLEFKETSQTTSAKMNVMRNANIMTVAPRGTAPWPLRTVPSIPASVLGRASL